MQWNNARTDKVRTSRLYCRYRLHRRSLLLTTKSTLPVDPVERRQTLGPCITKRPLRRP
jgi:hypothetical protein